MTDTAGRDARSEAERRRRLAEVFGEELPAQTRDDERGTDEAGRSVNDDWLRAQVPPHHG